MDVQPQREQFQQIPPPVLGKLPSLKRLPVPKPTARPAPQFLLRIVEDEPLVEAPVAKPAARPPVDPLAYRLFDVALASLFILMLGPVMLVVAMLICVTDRGPVIFRHVRIGRDGRCFECLKFRTMCVSAEHKLPEMLDACGSLQAEWERDHKIRRDPRVTAIGQVLRRFSIDELPQLFNVLRGDMSIVGPRPIVDAEVQRYADRFGDYCAVRPGLTGLWQVSGRNDVSYEERVQLDCEYVRTKSLTRDCEIIFRTLPVVMFGRGC